MGDVQTSAQATSGTGQTDPIVELVDVVKAFGPKVVLDGLSLAVQDREILVLVGRSGSGKSVTLKHLVGLMRPDSGTVRVLGMDMARATLRQADQVRRQVGYLFQGAALLNSIDVFENVALPLREHESLPEQELCQRVDDMLARVGLPDCRRQMPSQLSGGQRKRVGLARALIRNPRLILYDEPTAGLDPPTAAGVCDLIRRMRDELGVTSVVVTHEMEYAFRVADRIAMLHEGKIRTAGTPPEIRATEDPVVRGFILWPAEGPRPA